MAQPVWVLSVDLQAKTAVFQSGMAEAAKSARNSFKDIQSSAGEMSGGATRGFGDIRHSLGLLDNSIRRAHGAAMADAIRLTAQFVDVSAALPFAAMTGGFILLAGGIFEAAKKIQEFREQAEKLRNVQDELSTTTHNVFNTLDEKLLEAGIRADELNNNHLAALHKQLQLIDRQSLTELVHSFDEVTKAADKAFGEMKGEWYSMGIGSDGAKHALEQFKIKYDLLLAQGKDKEASDLLAGTRQTAQHVLDLMNQARAMGAAIEGSSGTKPDEALAFERARVELKKFGVSYTDKEVQSQQALLATLDAQLGVQERVSALKGI